MKRVPRARYAAGAALTTLALLTAASALAASSITKHYTVTVAVPAGRSRTLAVPYPDALQYGNARYRGHAVLLAPAAGASGRRPDLAKVRIVDRGSVLGGSEYEARAINDNAAGTAAVRLSVTATTVEPLPHS
jgi:hypothetical protein